MIWSWLPLLAVSAADPSAAPHLAPVLDGQKGEHAVAAYRAALGRFCGSRRDGGAGALADAASVGMVGDAEVETVCASGKWVKAVASGAFSSQGADEVLLQTASGVFAGMEGKLVLMRSAGGGGYRPAPWVLVGASFEARARVVVDGRRDVLVLCELRGHMGLYPGRCGFFGQGAFRGYRPEAAADRAGQVGDEPELGYVTACGRSESIAFEDVVLEDARLVMELKIQNVLRKPKGPDETAGGDHCSDLTVTSSDRARIGYEILPDTVRRATIIPKRLKDIANRYDY
jgi:hypothetical protein